MGIAREAALAEDDEAAPPAIGVDVPPVEEAKVEAIPPKVIHYGVLTCSPYRISSKSFHRNFLF